MRCRQRAADGRMCEIEKDHDGPHISINNAIDILPECKLCQEMWPEAAAKMPQEKPSPEHDRWQEWHDQQHIRLGHAMT